jgi:ATP-dependent helicase YprA (DUF1998 family)
VKQRLLQTSLQRVTECPCTGGCPSCVGPQRTNKEQAVGFFRAILKSDVRLVEHPGTEA